MRGYVGTRGGVAVSAYGDREGCYIEYDSRIGEDVIIYCPLHASSPETKKQRDAFKLALETIVDSIERYGEDMGHSWIQYVAQEAIKLAEPKDPVT